MELERAIRMQDTAARLKRLADADEAPTDGRPGESDRHFFPARDLIDEADDPLEFDIDGVLVRGSRGWFSSAPRYGKSYLSLHVASRLASGLPVLDHYAVPQPRRVLLISEEDGRRQVKRRLKALVTPEERDLWGDRFLVLIESGLRLDEAYWQAWLGAQLRMHAADVLILDVWRWLHSADTNSEKELKPILAYLTKLQRETGVTLILLTHDPKPKQGPDLGAKEARRISGNWVQWAWAQWGWFLKKRGNVVEVDVESKDLEASSFAFRFEGHEAGLKFVWQPPKLTEGEDRRKRLAEILIAGAQEWFAQSALADAVGVGRDTARRDLEVLRTEGEFESAMIAIDGTKKRAYRYVGKCA